MAFDLVALGPLAQINPRGWICRPWGLALSVCGLLAVLPGAAYSGPCIAIEDTSTAVSTDWRDGLAAGKPYGGVLGFKAPGSSGRRVEVQTQVLTDGPDPVLQMSGQGAGCVGVLTDASVFRDGAVQFVFRRTSGEETGPLNCPPLGFVELMKTTAGAASGASDPRAFMWRTCGTAEARPAIGALAGTLDVVAAPSVAVTVPDPADDLAAALQKIDAQYAAAQGLQGDARLKQLVAVKALLDRVADEFPASDVAMNLALGEPVGAVDPAALDAEIAALAATGTPAEPAAVVATDPASVALASCFGAPNLPAGPADPQARITVHANLDALGGILGMPDLVAPVPPDANARKLFQRSLMALDGCPALATLALPAGLDFSLTVQGVEGVTLTPEASSPAAQASDPAKAAEPAASIQNQPAAQAEQTVVSPKTETFAAPEVKPATRENEPKLNSKDVRDIQARLQVLGFDPGGIDGALGRGARQAISNWQAANLYPVTGYLDETQIGLLKTASQQNLDTWLLDPENGKLYDPPVIELTPGNVNGTWTFTAICGKSSRLPGMRVNGALNIRHQGGGRYAGAARNSQGFNGTFVGQIQGRSFSGRINWGLLIGVVDVQGTVAEQALVLRARDSNGCSVRGRHQ